MVPVSGSAVVEIDCVDRAAVVTDPFPPKVSAKREYSRTRPETFSKGSTAHSTGNCYTIKS